jgi:hypothetical protein
MKRTILAGLVLGLVLAGPVSAGRATIDVAGDPFVQGEAYSFDELGITWSANRDLYYWVRFFCSQPDRGLVLDHFQSLSTAQQQSGIVFASSLWTSGGATCTANLAAFTNSGLRYFASDTFEVMP